MNSEERKEISNEQRKKFKWDLEANLNHFMQPNFKQTFTQINSRTSLNLQSALPMSTFRLSSHWMLAQIWNFICRWHSSNTSFCYYRTVSLSYYYWLAKYVIPTEYRCGGNNSESTGFVLLLFICMCCFFVACFRLFLRRTSVKNWVTTWRRVISFMNMKHVFQQSFFSSFSLIV